MGDVKKKKEDSTEKVEQQDTTTVEKKKPVKAQPIDSNVGGIFSTKVVAIWHKIFGKK